MDYNFSTITHNDIDSVFPDYFEYFTRLYGSSFITGIARVAVFNHRYDSKPLAALDQAYGLTQNTIAASSGDGLKIISIRDSEGNIVGYFRVRFITIEGASIASVAELVLPNDLTDNRIDALKEMISAIETQITTNFLALDALDFEVGTSDEELQIALVEQGFSPLSKDNEGNRLTYMYEKPIKEKKATRE